MAWRITYGTYDSWSNDSAGWDGYTARQVIPASALSYSGNRIRVKLAYYNADWAFAKCYLGHQGVGDDYDFDGNQVQLLFSTSPGGTVGSGGLTSDEIDFDFDASKDLVISFYFSDAAKDTIPVNDSQAGYAVPYLYADDAATTDATGYTNVDERQALVEKIETQFAVSATTATLTITPKAATVIGATTIWANSASLTITTYPANLGTTVAAATASLTVTPNAATVNAALNIAASVVSLAITPQTAIAGLNISVATTTHALTITPFAADVEADIVHVNATAANLSLTPASATISWDLDILATTATLTITPNAATVWDGAAWAAWIAANESKASKHYYLILTGEDDSLEDVTIPIASFQARRSSTTRTRLYVVIKDLTYATAISDRPNGHLQLIMEYKIAGVVAYSDTIIWTHFNEIVIDKGSSSFSIRISGYRTETFTPKAITLRNIIYSQIKDGKYRYRTSVPDLYLSPGDTVTADGNTFTVAEIQYNVSPKLQTMEVRDAR